jgi:hypothetical protein
MLLCSQAPPSIVFSRRQVSGILNPVMVSPIHVSLEDLWEFAEDGEAPAQFELSERLFKGDGVDCDAAESVRWCRRAAEQGHLDAQWTMGVRYAHGQGVERNYAESVRWSRKAAERGHAGAQTDVPYEI